MALYQVKEEQCLIDLAVQLYGDSQYIVKLCVDNGLTLDTDLNGSMTLVYDDTIQALSDIATLLKVTGTNVATYTQGDGLGLLEHSDEEYTFTEHN